MSTSKLIASSKIKGCCTVTLREHAHGRMGSTYMVQYGKQVEHYDSIVLAQESYQSSVMHQFSCAGWNDGWPYYL